MPRYLRFRKTGGTYFFTQITENRAKILTSDLARPILREVMESVRAARPFEMEAVVLLPDHFHAIWRLPDGDVDYATRMASIKAQFTRRYRVAGGEEQPRSASRVRRGERAVWQRRFWEHTCRDIEDFSNHLDYIHWNPVKHGYVTCPHLWPWSTFMKWVERGVYPIDWRCVCNGQQIDPPDFTALDETAME